MNWRSIRAIARKDLLEVRQNKMAWMPMLLLPLIFCVILPLGVIILPRLFIPESAGQAISAGTDIAEMMDLLPPAMKGIFEGLDEHQSIIVFVLGYMLAPLFLILPLMAASVIGADSFVGEKERKTIEALLYTPATERELFVGKMLAAVLPAILLTWGAFVVYILILNGVGGTVMGRLWFPLPTWWPLILWVTPAVATLGMVGAVVISARVSTFMEAYQSTGLLVIPIILLVIGQISGIVYLSVEVALVFGLIIWLVDAVLLWLSLRLFSRTALMINADKAG